MYAFLIGIDLGVELPDHRVCECSGLVHTSCNFLSDCTNLQSQLQRRTVLVASHPNRCVALLFSFVFCYWLIMLDVLSCLLAICSVQVFCLFLYWVARVCHLQFFIHSGYTFFILCCITVLQLPSSTVASLPFSFPVVSFDKQKFLILMQSSYLQCLSCSRNFCLHYGHAKICLCFLLRILQFYFSQFNNLKLIFLCTVELVLKTDFFSPDG